MISRIDDKFRLYCETIKRLHGEPNQQNKKMKISEQMDNSQRYWHPSLHKAEEARQSVHLQLHTYPEKNKKTATQPHIIKKIQPQHDSRQKTNRRKVFIVI